MSKIIPIGLVSLLAVVTPHPALAAPSVLLPADQAKAMLEQCSRPSPAAVDGTWTVSAQAVDRLERDLPQLTAQVAKPREFYRQYVGITVQGQRLVYINAFYTANGANLPWRDRPMIVCDGGKSAWGALYNPKTRKFSDVQFNGR
jgi:hypothetical protein